MSTKSRHPDLSAVALDKGRATDRYNARNTATVTGQAATPEALPSVANEEELLQKLFQVKRRAIRQFDILKGEEGPRSGPRLIAEALNLLFEKYGKPPVA
jgi:hypothetical protein